MHFAFENSASDPARKIGRGIWLAAILCALLSMLDWIRYFPYILPGTAAVLIPGKYRKGILTVSLGVGAALAVLRWESFAVLANRMFAVSEAAQNYEYDYFTVGTAHPGAALALLSVMLGAACGLWGNPVNTAATAMLGISVAYFGVSPAFFWTAALVLAAAVNALPGRGSMPQAAAVALVVCLIAFAAARLAPEPLERVSALDETLRDALSGYDVSYAHTPLPEPAPEPEKTPPPPEKSQQPNRGIRNLARNIWFLLLSGITLLVLLLPAICKDRAEKRRRQNRAFLESGDNAAAIRGMYLYAKRWRDLDGSPSTIPKEVESIWLEAAYSDHALTETQKKTMERFVRDSAEKVWQAADWKKRLAIRYKYAL